MAKRAAPPVRFDERVGKRLASFVAAHPGLSISSAANRLVDEGLRMSEHPGVGFRDGPTGRRAGLVGGPDVWELVRAVMSARAGEPASSEDDVLDLVVENTGLPVRLVRTAVRYWTSYPDEVFSDEIAEQLRAKGHDVRSVVTDPSMIALPDDQLLARAEAMGRALVTANVTDFAPLDRHYKSVGRVHTGLVFVAARTFPQDRSFVGALVTALDPLLTERADIADRVVFLER